MSLKWLEGFGLYNRKQFLRQSTVKWHGGVTRACQMRLVEGRKSGQAVRMSATHLDSDSLRTPHFEPQSGWVVGFAWKPVSPRLDGTLLRLCSPDNLEQISVRVAESVPGTLFVYRGQGTLLGSCDWTPGEWQCLEIKVRIDAVHGRMELRRDGKTGCLFEGNTRSSISFASVDHVQFLGVSGDYDLTDIWVFDDNGKHNNDFLHLPQDYMVCCVLPHGDRAVVPCDVTGEIKGVIHQESDGKRDTSKWTSPVKYHLSRSVQEHNPWTALPWVPSDLRAIKSKLTEGSLLSGAEVLGNTESTRDFSGSGRVCMMSQAECDIEYRHVSPPVALSLLVESDSDFEYGGEMLSHESDGPTVRTYAGSEHTCAPRFVHESSVVMSLEGQSVFHRNNARLTE